MAAEPADEARTAFESAKLALVAAVNEVPKVWNDRDGRRQSEVLDALAEAVQLVVPAKPHQPDLLKDLIEKLDEVPAPLASP
jgi:hypothetical protein